MINLSITRASVVIILISIWSFARLAHSNKEKPHQTNNGVLYTGEHWQFRELLNHLYRICGIHECIHTYHRSRIHTHEYKIIYGGSGAFVSPKFQEKKYLLARR